MSTAPIAPPAPSGPQLAAAVRQIATGAAAVRDLVAAGALGELSDAAVSELALVLHRASETCDAVSATAVARVADSGYPAVEGFLTPASWWRSRTKTSRDGAGDRVRFTRRLRQHYQVTATWWGQGKIDGAQAQILTSGLDGVLTCLKRHRKERAKVTGETLSAEDLAQQLNEARADFEARFLVLASKWGTDTRRTAIKAARELADPDGGSAAGMRAASESCTTITEVGDMSVIKSYVTRDVAAMVRTVLDHYRNARYAAGKNPCDPSTEHACEVGEIDPVTGERITITNAQRDGAAFTDWVTATLDSGLGSEKQSERPHLDVTVSLTDLAAASTSGAGWATVQRLGSPIPVHSALRVGCAADVRLVLVETEYRDPHTGEVIAPELVELMLAGAGILDYGRSKRIVTSDLRRALALRDQGCAFPDCVRPPAHTQAHHVKHWVVGGTTALDNTVLLCSRHHHYVHEGGWRITPRIGLRYNQAGYWDFTPPDPPRRS